MVIAFTVLHKPTPKGGLNARLTKNGKISLWYPATVKRAQAAFRAVAEDEMKRGGYPKLGARCVVHARFFIKQTSTGRLRGDVDKLARLVLDGLTGTCLEDDELVQGLVASKHAVEENGLERTEVSVSLAG